MNQYITVPWCAKSVKSSYVCKAREMMETPGKKSNNAMQSMSPQVWIGIWAHFSLRTANQNLPINIHKLQIKQAECVVRTCAKINYVWRLWSPWYLQASPWQVSFKQVGWCNGARCGSTSTPPCRWSALHSVWGSWADDLRHLKREEWPKLPSVLAESQLFQGLWHHQAVKLSEKTQSCFGVFVSGISFYGCLWILWDMLFLLGANRM